MSEAIRDRIREDATTVFPETKLVEHDDHWLRPTRINAVDKLPAFFISLAGTDSDNDTDADDAVRGMETDTQIDIHWLAPVDRIAALRGSASEVIEYLYDKFTPEDYDLDGFGEVGVLLRACRPLNGANYNELLDAGLVGCRVTIGVDTSHFQQ